LVDKKTIEVSGNWECLDISCDVLIRRDMAGKIIETRIRCPVDKTEHAQKFQSSFADPEMKKRISVETKKEVKK